MEQVTAPRARLLGHRIQGVRAIPALNCGYMRISVRKCVTIAPREELSSNSWRQIVTRDDVAGCKRTHAKSLRAKTRVLQVGLIQWLENSSPEGTLVKLVSDGGQEATPRSRTRRHRRSTIGRPQLSIAPEEQG